MNNRPRWTAAAAGAVLLLLGGLAWRAWHPRPDLDGVAGWVDSGRYLAAESRLRAYLRADPVDESARLLLARVLLERPDREPVEALGLVQGVGPADPKRAARVRAVEGEAQFWLGRYDLAESAWREALRLDPTIPEVGWKVLNIYAVQGREEESRRLALALFAREPDEKDRVQWLLHLIRHDAHPIEAGSIVHELGPIVRANPADARSSEALGLAMIRSGRIEEGLKILRESARTSPDDPGARLAFLDGLAEAGLPDDLAQGLDALPAGLAGSARFDAVRGWLAAQRGDPAEASRFYLRAFEARPSDPSLAYRLKGALRQADRLDALAELGPRLEAVARFRDVARDLFDRINAMPDLGIRSRPAVFQETSVALARVGRSEEAAAWSTLARRHGGGPP